MLVLVYDKLVDPWKCGVGTLRRTMKLVFYFLFLHYNNTPIIAFSRKWRLKLNSRFFACVTEPSNHKMWIKNDIDE